MNMPIWLIVILCMVCIIVGYFVGCINTDAPDAALAADKPVDGERTKPKVSVDKARYEGLVALWRALRPDSMYDPMETLQWRQREMQLYRQDAVRLVRQRDYYQGKRPAHLAFLEHGSEDLQRLRDQLDGWSEGAMSRTAIERNEYRRMLRCYVGAPEKAGVNPLGETTQRHMFIQEQASQCGYSTILYSLSPSSSIFTPNYVNGFQQFAQRPAPSCDVTSTSSASPAKSETPLNGLSDIGFRVQVDTIYPSSHRGT